MTSYFEIKKHWVILFSLMLGSLTSFSQNFTDQQVGFNVEQTTIDLKERGINDPQELNREIQAIREMQISEYLIIQKIENEILQKINALKTLRIGLLNATVTDIPQSEKEALLAIFNSTNGTGWTTKTGWDFNTPVSTGNGIVGWYGVTVSNGHVVGLNLRSNNLIGILPVEISQLKNLTTLDLYSNKLNSIIPNEIGQLENLQILKLDYNQFIGSIPQGIGQAKNLQVLSLYGNKLTGNIPFEIGQLSNLQTIDAGNNQLTGSLPSEIGKLGNLQLLNLPSNKLGGIIPSEIGLLKNLTSIVVCYNQFTGIVPSEIANLTKLTRIDLRDNQLSGILPSGIGQLIQMYRFEVSNNKLSGVIPPQIGLLKKLSIFSIENNLFTGNLPHELGDLPLLKEFYARQNRFTGTVPVEMELLKNLTSFVIDNNLLDGNLIDLSNSTMLSSLNISSNRFRFVDFGDQFSLYKTKLGAKFIHSPQSKTDNPKTVNSTIGEAISLVMFEDNRFTQADTFQWYKNGSIVTGATSRIFTISNLKATDSGTYFCRASHTSNPDMSPLILEREPITLNAVNCSPIIGTIKTVN